MVYNFIIYYLLFYY